MRSFLRSAMTVAALGGLAYMAQDFSAQPDFSQDAALPTLSQLNLVPSAFAADKGAKLDWKTLRGLNYRTGEMTPALKQVNGKEARVPGYMVPLEDDSDKVSEFLLVPYVGACIHTPPPPPNQIVHVVMNGGRKVKMSDWEPIWVEGNFAVSTVKSPYGDVSFKMQANAVEPYAENQ